jgi:site-specific DNA recombinase
MELLNVCIYLRKSRADREAEARGEGETLARHERILLDLAKKRGYNVGAIYKEIVSGETISARPVMQQLLREVESGMWDGVLVVEVERLARGDTIDQGVVARSFQYSNTLIITPLKTYDPNNEYDEEYFEFGLFMSRREYKTIRRRLTAGRESSAKEGKYCGSKPPYGYSRVKLVGEKGWTLQPVPDQAEIVKLIFNLYVHGVSGERIVISFIKC